MGISKLDFVQNEEGSRDIRDALGPTHQQMRSAAGDLAKAARLPPCDARRFLWTPESVDASTTTRRKGTAPSLGHVMLPGFLVITRGKWKILTFRNG